MKSVSIIDVREAIKVELPHGYPTIIRTADRLGVSQRTLQRRLQDAGSSYKQVVDQTRMEIARRLLSGTGRRIKDVAMALGYVEPRSFTRAFERWTGTTPRAYRCGLLRTARGGRK